MPTDNTIEALKRLEAVKAKRGYLLPHHGLMALTAPELLAGYDACYTALTLVPRTLSEYDREFVWLGVLTARREHIASQHLVKFFKDQAALNATAAANIKHQEDIAAMQKKNDEKFEALN